MKQYLRIFSMLLLMLIGIGGGDVFGAEETVKLAVGFETSEGFTTDTDYQSTVTGGATGSQWTIKGGTFSKNEALSGSSSAQCRVYSSQKYNPTIETKFSLTDITKITFKAKVGNNKLSLKAQYSTDGTNWTGDQTFKLTTSAADYTYTINQTTAVYIKFTVLYSSLPSSTIKFWLDDVNFYTPASSLPSSDLTLTKEEGEVNVGSQLDISSFKTTADGYEGTISYTVTSGTDVASVNANGVITGLKVGTATIEVKAAAVSEQFGESKKDFTVNVVENRTASTTSFGAEVDNQTINVKEGEESAFTAPIATLTPAEAGSLTYNSSNTSAISVDENTGAITLKEFGKATITASFAGNATYMPSSASYIINYYDPSMIVFSDEYGSFDKIGGGGYQTGNKTFVDQNGIEYTFNLNRSYKNNNGLQMEKNNGKVISPAIKTTYGYKLIVETNTNQVTISFGDLKTTTTAGYGELSITNSSASFTIEAGSKFAVVSKIQIIPFTEHQKKEAVVTFPEASYTTFPGKSFTAPTASVKNTEGEAISGAKVTYSISGDDIATIDANTGAVTPKADAFGTATITATFAGDATYKEATGSYTLAIKEVIVASDISNLITQGTADDTKLYSINLTQAQVLKVHGSGIYVSNGTSFVAVKSLTNDAVVEGKLLSGKLIGKYSLSYYVPTLTLETEPTLTIEDGISTLAGTSISADEAEDHINELVTISGTTSISSSKQYLGNVQLYNKYGLNYAAPYTGSKLSIRGVIIKYNSQLQILPLTKYDIIYHFDEAKDNAVGDAADVKVQLTRTLSKDYWNTFCVPFSMTAEQIAATFGEGTKVTEYTTTEGTTLNFTEATEINAGVPYLIKPAATTANPTIEGVTIAAGDADEKGSPYKFIGIYSPKALATNGTELFIGTDSKLYSPAEGKNTIKGMRAYLNVPAGTEGARLNILGEMVTAIDGVSLNGNDEVKVFNLKGQRVGNTTKGLAKGIYVVNGKKMVINK